MSEVLAITSASFVDDGYDLGVWLKTLKQGTGRPSKRSLQRSPKRFIPILNRDFQTRIQSYLWMGKFRKDERIFPITRQAVSANIDRLIDQMAGEPPFKIGFHTFLHSFAVHLLLHVQPLKFASQLLSHRSAESTGYPISQVTDQNVSLYGVCVRHSITIFASSQGNLVSSLNRQLWHATLWREL
tara:strand:- start:3639 stop:4193 length:555 start_codon:yes stop_codon:yes gene_type:complete